jgi:hypothetical protein
MMDNNDELTIAARVKGWDIFVPNWDYLRQYPALQIASLCALSVGLHPAFASPGWVFNIAMPHFSGTDPDECCPLEDAAEGAKWAALLDDFLRRVHIAVGNLVPRGTLPIADGAVDGERTVVKVADFATWADGMGWNLPPEFPRTQADAVVYPVASEGLQTGGAKWPWGNHETELLRKLAAAAERYYGVNFDPMEKEDSAPKSADVTAWLKEKGVADRVAEVMAQILRPDGLRTGPR